jgi:hypothetical protein
MIGGGSIYFIKVSRFQGFEGFKVSGFKICRVRNFEPLKPCDFETLKL